MTPDPDRPAVLALRALGLGDLLVTVPALKAIRAALPEHRLVLATSGWLAPIVDLVPAVDDLLPTAGLTAPLALEETVDTTVNLHGRGPQSDALLAALHPARAIRHGAPEGPEWIEAQHERARWIRLTTAFGMPGDPDDVRIERPDAASPAPGAAVLHVGAAFGSRRWPAPRFAEVARALAAAGRHVVLSGDAADRDRAVAVADAAGLDDEAVLAGRMPLDAFAALVAEAAVVVTGDTGAGHLASAYGTPSVVLFGPVGPDRWGPPPGPHVVLGVDALRAGDPFAADPDPALAAVTVADVLAAVAAVL